MPADAAVHGAEEFEQNKITALRLYIYANLSDLFERKTKLRGQTGIHCGSRVGAGITGRGD